MQKLLTVYKFNFPFIIEEFEKVKYDSILEDLEKLFLYSEIFENKIITKRNNFTTTVFNLKNYKAEIIIYNSKINKSTESFSPLKNINKNPDNKYFIPKLEFNFYQKKENKNNDILKNIFDIFISTGRNNYIFDYEEKEILFKNSGKVLTINTLKQFLDKYTYNELRKFLKNTPNEYIGEELMTNNQLRNSFYFIIYLCYNFYNNLLKTENGKKEISNILKNNNSIENKAILKLSEKRLNILEKNLLINFISYKKTLDKLFDMLKKIR